jgi:hypothetical protein
MIVNQKMKRKEERALKQGTSTFERKQLFLKQTSQSALSSEFASALDMGKKKIKGKVGQWKGRTMPKWKRAQRGKGMFGKGRMKR